MSSPFSNACWVTQIAVCHELRVLSNVPNVAKHTFAGVKIEYLARETWCSYAVTLAGPLIQDSGVPANWAYTLTSSRVEYLWAWTAECTLLLIVTLAGCQVQ